MLRLASTNDKFFDIGGTGSDNRGMVLMLIIMVLVLDVMILKAILAVMVLLVLQE